MKFFLLLLFFPLFAFGQDLPTVAGQVQSASSMTVDSFIGTVMQIISYSKGSVPVGLKIAGVTLVIMALLKVSFLQSLWDKMGSFKAILAPILGLVLGLSFLGVGGPLSVAAVLAYLASGTGAIALHELLDMVKAIPGLGAVYVGLIDAIESVLGGGTPPTPPAP